jgi:hypothetical protein
VKEQEIGAALRQVRRIQSLLGERSTFRGYSGTARLIGAAAALIGGSVLAIGPVPSTPVAHLAGWAAVLAVALTVNYAGLLAWFLFHPEADRSIPKLTPAVDAVPALGVGAVMSVAAVVHGTFDLLFGIWMTCYGLAHMPYRKSLPGANYVVGVFYLVAGTACLLYSPDFTNPWPMGLVFFAGETAGGLVLRDVNRPPRTATPPTAKEDKESPNDSTNDSL